MMSNKHSADEFDRSICFSCFSTWVDALRTLAVNDTQAALDAFFILSDFCLYGLEPDPENNPWSIAWPIVRDEARRSINNRRRGFGAEDVALSDAIRKYHAEYPEASQRAIAEAVGCSVGKVNKTLKAAPPNTPVVGTVHGNGSSEYNNPFSDGVEQNETEIFGAATIEE